MAGRRIAQEIVRSIAGNLCYLSLHKNISNRQ